MEVLTIDVLEGARESILDLVGGSKYLAQTPKPYKEEYEMRGKREGKEKDEKSETEEVDRGRKNKNGLEAIEERKEGKEKKREYREKSRVGLGDYERV